MKEKILSMSREELIEFIFQKKAELKDEVCILEHNFQLEDLLQFADIVGDTTSLLKKTQETTAEFLIYTGAKFFTEAGCILCPEKRIMQANIKADCPLTYIVDEKVTEEIFHKIREKSSREVVPMSYFTASYQLKSFCGRNNGTACTASNAYTMMKYYLDQGQSIFFTPMSNIAFNVIQQLGLSDQEIAIIDGNTDISTLTGDEKIYIWDVGCYVHSDFKVEDLNRLRKQYEGIQFIAHLECLPDVIENCEYGSFTDGINDIIKNNPKQNAWGLATVSNFANRIAKQHPDKTIVPVRPDLICKDMIVTDLVHLAESLQSIIDYKAGTGTLKTELKVPEAHRKYALEAINKMYEILTIQRMKDAI